MLFTSDNFQPTFLYIKQHNKTGLKYFGKTCNENVIEYPGSGTYWTSHLNIHGNNVTTIWYKRFYNKTELVDYAIRFSYENNIVSGYYPDGRKIWANLRVEDGLMGGRPSEEGIQQIRDYWGDAYYILTIGAEKIRKEKETKASQEWKDKKYKLCGHCNNSFRPDIYKQYHGNMCKDYILRISFLKLCNWCNIEVTGKDYNTWHGDKCNYHPENIKLRTCEYCNTLCQSVFHYNERHGENCRYNPYIIENMYCNWCNTQCKRKTDYKRWHGENCKHK